jgi:inosine/xanthosine triphosphatase
MTGESLSKQGRWLVGVGSRNPTKVEAVRRVLEKALAENLLPVATVEIRGLEVPSGVSDQPLGEEETRRGALERAQRVLAELADEIADFGVGIEGGVVKLENGLYTTAWCAIVDRKGNRSFGGGLIMPLPPPMVRDLEAGYELGEATDRLYSVKNSKHAGGALGYLSKGLHSRQGAYEAIFTYALTSFLNPELYELL